VVADFARASALSLPGIPPCPGAHAISRVRVGSSSKKNRIVAQARLARR
jgi:hypothetical protein